MNLPIFINFKNGGNSLVVQGFGLRASTAGGTGLIPDGGTKFPHAAWHGQKKKRERERERSHLKK